MTIIVTLKEAVSRYVKPGMTVALEGFTHLIPNAAGLEIIRQGVGDLTLIRMTPDLIYDQMIGMGCANKLIFSWGGNPGVGSLHRFRDAYENANPRALAIEEHDHAAMANAYAAGAAGLPLAIFDGYRGTSYPEHNSNIRSIACPFSGKKLSAVPALRPDVGIIHAQRADRFGNIWLDGIQGVQKEVVLASEHTIVTVEEIVDRVSEREGGTVIPNWVINAVCEVPSGAFPSYASGYYERHNSFYIQWDKISRDYRKFRSWMRHFVLETKDFAEYMDKLREENHV
uniref:CoA transferase subunit A n=1 Tax=Marinobacterium profundum TaxID=1714300 RepID=UPI0008341D2F|nr:CoA-transferase [Marinobacterium profundum]